ncbi:hypothetical protein ES708_05362 [subsurface metagenome]
MVKITNIFGDRYSGQAGHAGVFAVWKGRQYRRMYVIPSNPKTPMQMIIRGFFTNAVTLWHVWSSLKRLAFSYLVSGQVMSGFNLLVSRYQKAATTGATLPLAPVEGIKQICSASTPTENTAITEPNPFPLTAEPVKIGSLTYTPLGVDTIIQDAYVDLEMGDVRIPVAITNSGGGEEGGEAIAVGDKLLISYKAGGRDIVDEELYVVPAEGSEIPARATIAVAFRTKYYPIDMESVVIEIWEALAAAKHETPLESLEILNCGYTMVAGEAVPAAWIYFDGTVPTAPESKVDYTSYVAVYQAKLEVTKVDTSFVTWRRYSDPVGCILIAQTIEDETYDWNLSAPEYLSEIRAAQSAVLATKHELVEMASAA